MRGFGGDAKWCYGKTHRQTQPFIVQDCVIFSMFLLVQSCLVDYEAYVDESKVCEKETVTDCR